MVECQNKAGALQPRNAGQFANASWSGVFQFFQGGLSRGADWTQELKTIILLMQHLQVEVVLGPILSWKHKMVTNALRLQLKYTLILFFNTAKCERFI